MEKHVDSYVYYLLGGMSGIPRIRETEMKTAFIKEVLVGFAFVAILVGRTVHGDDNDAREAPASSFPVLSGIGAALSITDAGPQITVLVPGSAAERSGRLHKGDLILSIREGNRTIDLRGKPLGEVVSHMRGPVGTTVTLKIASGDDESGFLVTLKREAVALPGLYQRRTYENLIGEPAPDVPFSTLDQTSHIDLSGYEGMAVVIDFWASWCGTCYAPVDKMQEIARAHPEWKGRVALLTVTIDTDLQAASEVIETRGWEETTHLSLAPEDLEAMKIATIPTVLIISPDGKIATAGDSHSISIEKEVSRLLAPTATDSHSK